MKVKGYYWDYINSEDYLDNRMTESELKYHYSNMTFAQPLYRELENNLSNKKPSLFFSTKERETTQTIQTTQASKQKLKSRFEKSKQEVEK